MAGRAIMPMATTVAPTMPVEAAKSAPTKMTEMPRPPRSWPKRCPIVSSKSSAQSALLQTDLIRTNSGDDDTANTVDVGA